MTISLHNAVSTTKETSQVCEHVLLKEIQHWFTLRHTVLHIQHLLGSFRAVKQT